MFLYFAFIGCVEFELFMGAEVDRVNRSVSTLNPIIVFVAKTFF